MKELRRYFSYLGEYKFKYWGVLCITMFISVFLNLATPYMNKLIFNALEYKNMEMFKRAVLLCLMLVVINCLFPYCRYFHIKTVRMIVVNIKIKLFDKLMSMSMHYYEKCHSGEAIKILNWDADSLKTSYFTQVYRIIVIIIGGGTSLVAMFIYSPVLACVSLLFCIFTVYVSIYINRKIKILDGEIQAKVGKLTAHISDILSGFVLLKMYRGSVHIIDRFHLENEEVTEKGIQKVNNHAQLETTLYLLDIISGFGTIIVGTYMVSKGRIDFGTVMAIVSLQGTVGFMMQGFGVAVSAMTSSLVKAGRVFDFLEMDGEENLGVDEEMDIDEALPPVKVDHITFSYDEKKVLDNFTLMVYPRETLAIKGESGWGKSTFLKILLGFYEADAGQIQLFGHRIEQLSLSQRRKLVTYVPQDSYLFEGSIFENIVYGDVNQMENCPETPLYEAVIKAAKMSYADEFINGLPDKYDTHVVAGGTNLSGGQRQRIGLARAFFKNSPIILLDEPSSALDAHSETMINKAISDYMCNQAVLIVSHKGDLGEYVDRTYAVC